MMKKDSKNLIRVTMSKIHKKVIIDLQPKKWKLAIQKTHQARKHIQ